MFLFRITVQQPHQGGRPRGGSRGRDRGGFRGGRDGGRGGRGRGGYGQNGPSHYRQVRKDIDKSIDDNYSLIYRNLATGGGEVWEAHR